jgi:hypothetical protein
LPTPPTGEQNQKKRTYDVLPKPDNLIRYRQTLPSERFSSAALIQKQLALIDALTPDRIGIDNGGARWRTASRRFNGADA